MSENKMRFRSTTRLRPVGREWGIHIARHSGFSFSRAVLAAGLLTFLLAHANDANAQGWYNSSWLYRKAITIDYTKVGSGPHTNFPVLINRTDSDLQSNAQADADDILFTSSDGTTKLDHEIESYTSGTGALVAWVEIPSLSSSANTVIYMYYGYASATNQQNVTGTWNSNYKGVWHLNEASNPYNDATSNVNNSTSGNYPSQTDAKIGKGQSFNGSSQYIGIRASASLELTSNGTISCWFNVNSLKESDAIEKGGNGGYTVWQSSSTLEFGKQNDSQSNWAVWSGGITTGQWYKVDGVSQSGTKSLYINGVFRAQSSGATDFTNTDTLRFAKGIDGYLNGLIDDVRVMNVAQSAGWILTEYNNQNSPSTFYSVGAQEITYTISGNVFEDVNYGGGAGRSKASSSGVSQQYADVELYNSGGVYVSATNTDASGNYSFTGLSAGTYYVRVVNDSVRSSRTGWTTSCKPVMTYRTNAASGTAVAVTDYVGGTNPAASDPGVGSSGATFNTTTFVYSAILTGTAQAVTQCVIGSANITGVDFGFNYNTIANTNNSGQGSLRQVITNMNTLGNTGLSIVGQTAGQDVSVFMISDGNAHPGLRAGLTNQLTSGVATITSSTVLPTISSSATSIDATTQTTNIGNTNSGSVGTGGTVGVDAITLPQYPRPEVAINANNFAGLVVSGAASSILIQGLAVYNATDGISVSGGAGTSNTIRNVLAGTLADGTDPVGALRNTGYGISISSPSTYTVDKCYVGWNGQSGILGVSNLSVLTVTYNEVFAGGWNSSGHDGLDIDGINGTVQYNLSYNNTNNTGTVNHGSGDGLEMGSTSYGGNGNNLVENNTLTGNVSAGILIKNGANGNTIRKNLVYGNPFGIIVAKQSSTANANQLTMNSVYGNTNLGIDLTADANAIPDGVTANNGTLNSALSNNDMDHPVFTSAGLSGTTLAFSGYVGSAPSQSTFANAIVEIFKSDNDASGYGEGQTYLGRDTCDANGNFSGSFTVAGLSVGDKITGTATDGSNNTSEFGANYSATGIYYSKGSLAVNTASNWNTARDGSGTDAGSFGTGNSFVIQNTHAMTLTGSNTWNVSATGIVQIENGGSWTNSSSGAVTAGTLQVDNGGSYAHGTTNALPGTSKSFGATSTMSYYGATQTVEALTYGHLTIASAGTRTLGGNATVAGDLSVTGGTFDLSTYTANRSSAGGTITVANGATLKIGGTNSFASNYSTTTLGATSTVEYYGTAQSVAGKTYGHLTLSNGNTKSAAAAVTVAGDLTIGSTTTFDAGSYTHVMQGNWSNSGTFTAGTSTIQLTGSSAASITGATTFNVLEVNKSASTTTVTLNNNVTTTTLTMTQGKMLTGSNSILVTSSRTGNGLVIGTITRTHTFSASTAYAFEGPYNTLTFNSGGTLPTSVTVTTTLSSPGANDYMDPITRYYAISQTGGTGFTYTLRLHYEDSEVSAPNSETSPPLRIWRRTATVPDVWTREGATSNSTVNNWVEQTGLTNVGTFSLSSRTVADIVLTLGQSAANPSPGDQVTYTLDYANNGDGSSTNTVVTASAPTNTSYVAGQTRLNGVLKTDAADADEVTVSGSTITINLGAVVASGSGTITYKVVVN